ANSTNELWATVIPQSALLPGGSPVAIQATTQNVQQVYFTAVGGAIGSVEIGSLALGGHGGDGTGVLIDARDMRGVEQWWSWESEAGLEIHNARDLDGNTIVGMNGTEAWADFEVLFRDDELGADGGDS